MKLSRYKHPRCGDGGVGWDCKGGERGPGNRCGPRVKTSLTLTPFSPSLRRDNDWTGFRAELFDSDQAFLSVGFPSADGNKGRRPAGGSQRKTRDAVQGTGQGPSPESWPTTSWDAWMDSRSMTPGGRRSTCFKSTNPVQRAYRKKHRRTHQTGTCPLSSRYRGRPVARRLRLIPSQRSRTLQQQAIGHRRHSKNGTRPWFRLESTTDPTSQSGAQARRLVVGLIQGRR